MFLLIKKIPTYTYIHPTRGQAMDSFAYPAIFQLREILPKRIKFHVASQEIEVASKI